MSFPIRIADGAYNGKSALTALQKAESAGTAIALLPRLCLTGATCGDLFSQQALLNDAWQALKTLAAATQGMDLLAVVGLPVAMGGRVYDCAAVLKGGALLWLRPAPQAAPPFAPGPRKGSIPGFSGESVPFGWGYHLMAESPLGLSIDLATDLLSAGASIVLCQTAKLWHSGERAAFDAAALSRMRRNAILLSQAGVGESTTNGVMDGRCGVWERGICLGLTRLFSSGEVITELDLGSLHGKGAGQAIPVSLPQKETPLSRWIDPMPFLFPEEEAPQMARDLLEAQAQGLRWRMERAHARRPVIGVSGGVDSTLALLAATRAMDLMRRDAREVLAVTMPCFGTSRRTHQNALALAKGLDVELREIPLTQAVSGHLKDIGHDGVTTDAAYENAQARERTQVLMDLSNMENGLVVGTGDLSELALGWATYNGDHMSMYGVNAGIPKTLIRQVLLLLADDAAYAAIAPVLRDIVDTPVSPELLPGRDGEIGQITEEVVGPYDLHDFFLYHCLSFGSSPRKIFRLCRAAFAGRYDDGVILRWMELFYRRFFSAQFKRSCLPDGPGVLAVGLSPRGQWSMPSDATAAAWLRQVEELLSRLPG